MAEAKPLRLKAEDQDDLTVISAALQDAVGQLGDFSFDARSRRFLMVVNRYRWEAARPGKALSHGHLHPNAPIPHKNNFLPAGRLNRLPREREARDVVEVRSRHRRRRRKVPSALV